MDRWLKSLVIICVAILFSFAGQSSSFTDQPDASNDSSADQSAVDSSADQAPVTNMTIVDQAVNSKGKRHKILTVSSDTSSEIITPDSTQPQESTQKVTVSKSQLISLDYTNANLTDVLKAISYSYNINIIITKDLTGKITAKLKDFTLDDALNAILGLHDYGFMRKNGIVYIVPKEDLDQETESLPLSFITLKEAESLLKGAKSKFSGTIQQNEDANTLIVTATPSDMAMIKEYLKGIDVPPIQVMIDAELVNISKNYSKDLGTTMNFTYTPSSGVGLALQTGSTVVTSTTPGTLLAQPSSSSTSSSTSSSSGSSGASGSTSAGNPIGSGTDGSLGGIFGHWKNISPTMAINALVTENKARVIASPSIATLNGHEASILIGDHYPYISSSTSTTGAGASGVTSQTQTQYIDIGTKLKVTPIVSPDGWITLKVEPEVSQVINTIQGNPEISTSTAKTEVRVRDNQTIVIGGLDSRNDNYGSNGTPGLMNIPILGWLFKHNTVSTDDGTLTVLITPHIVPMCPIKPFVDTKAVSENPSFQRGDDSNVIEGMLSNAEELEQDKTKDSAKNLYISEEQIKIYRKILEQFPRSGKTDFCLYKIALIYGKEFGNCAAAKEALTEMKDFFPQSPYIKVTSVFVNACLVVGDEEDK